MTGSVGYSTELSSRTAQSTPLAVAKSDLPSLKPLPPQQAGTAVVVAEAPKQPWFSFRRAPDRPRDPNIDQANTAAAQVHQLTRTLANLHTTLASNTYILANAPNHWEELVTPYNAARASAIAMLGGLAARLDLAALDGAAAALSQPSRSIFERCINDIRVADVEFASLAATCESRHAEARTAAERAADAKARVAAAKLTNAEELKELTGELRKSLEARIAKLFLADYRFARHAPEINGELPWIQPHAVIPTLALEGQLLFGKTLGYSIPAADARPIASARELVELVDTLMGRDDGPHKEIKE